MMYGHTKYTKYIYENYSKSVFVELFYDEENVTIKNFRKRIDITPYRTDEVIERM